MPEETCNHPRRMARLTWSHPDGDTKFAPSRKGGDCPPPHLQLTESRRMAGRMSANARLLTAPVHANLFPPLQFSECCRRATSLQTQIWRGFQGIGHIGRSWAGSHNIPQNSPQWRGKFPFQLDISIPKTVEGMGGEIEDFGFGICWPARRVCTHNACAQTNSKY